MPQAVDGQHEGVDRGSPPAFWRVLTFWVPRRFVTEAGINIEAFVADVNRNIRQRGFIMSDGQIITTPLDPVEPVDPIFEFESLHEPLTIPERRSWEPEQRAYFGLDDPYQMANESDTFTYSHVMSRIVEPYLAPGELILALLHGELDNSYFTCTCHYATVVYTTRHRLVCMSCGATHLVLREPLSIVPKQLLTAEEWDAFFDDTGNRHHDEVDLPLVDFRDVEHASTIWRTDQWDDAAHEFVFFARSSPEEIQNAIRGTEADPSIFLEAGWTRQDLPPPPALQLMSSSISVSLGRNAEHAFADGVAAFLASYVKPERLLTAVPQLFRAVELLLKARLRQIDAHALDDKPDNPTVLNRLHASGVKVTPEEADVIKRLRRLRNDLQHGEATLNHRAGLALCRQAVIFVDRFADDELNLWTASALPTSDWQALLDIPEIAARAGHVVDKGLDPYRADPDASIVTCPRCHRLTMLRPHPATGASCAYCGHIPVQPDD